MFALFNKNKEFVGYSPEIPENSEILKIKLPEEKSDILTWKWEGDYDTGRMVPIDIGYPIEEIELEREFFDFINKNYPLQIQMINIIKQLRKVIENDENLQNYEFMDMSDYILNAVEKMNNRINYYKNYYKLISKDETKKFKQVFDE